MRIGLVIYGSLETISGGYLYDRKLVEFLLRHDDQVEIISLPWRSYPRHLGDNLSTSLLRRLQGLQVDVLLQDELNHPSLFWVNRRMRPEFPVVSIVHHLRSSETRPTWQNRLYSLVERSYLRSVDGFIFNSHTTQRVVQGLVGEENPAVVAYPAGDRLNGRIGKDEILLRAAQPGPLRVLFLGNVIPRKGLHVLLEALSHAQPGLCELSVVGRLDVDRAYARRLLRSVTAKGLTSQVSICGPLDDESLSALLRSSHLLVVPSSYEGFGIVYLEGMMFGLPAIAASGGGAAEIVREGENGYLIAPEDWRALTHHLEILAMDRQLLVKLSLAARQSFAAHPTWEQSGGKIRDYLLEVVEA